jgi:hypothetical protein
MPQVQFGPGAPRQTLDASATPKGGGRIATSDVGSSSAIHQDVQLVLRCALPWSDTPENFGVHEPLTGKVGVNVGLQRMGFLESFQQAPLCP